jgi:L-threonylcarbamoyladenylate synthase
MERIRSEAPEALAAVERALSRGGVAVIPTDTLYGLSTPISSRAGHDRVVAIKGGEAKRRFLYLASSIDMVARFIGDWGCASRAVLDRVWPAPLTAVFRARPDRPEWVSGTIALRVPANDWLRRVIGAVGEPILSTSVNEAGTPPLESPDDIERTFGSRVDLVVDGGRLAGGKPSTLVDFTGSAPVVLREGAYVWVGRGKPSN